MLPAPVEIYQCPNSKSEIIRRAIDFYMDKERVKAHIKTLIFSLLLVFSSLSIAQEKTFIHEYTHKAGDADSIESLWYYRMFWYLKT